MAPATLHRVEREWRGRVDVEVRFPMRPVVTTRYNEAVAIERGPLVFALKIGEEWTRVNADKPHRELPHGDFEVRPTTPWNYGLVVDETRPTASARFSASAARNCAVPNSFTDSQTRRPGKPRDSSGPYWAGS